MIRLILLGLVAGAFFSSTFVLNELMSVAGGHWYWSASLRYVFMLILLTAIIASQHGWQRIAELWQVFRRYWQFWCVTGGIGFGLFYAGICYAADHASGWVVASTFMFTVVASLFVLYAFVRRFDRQVIVYALMIFIGVVCANISEAMHSATVNTSSDSLIATDGLLQVLLLGALPALIAAFSYPIGNQLVWQASHNASQRHNTAATTASAQLVSSWQRHIPTIDTELLGNGVHNAFNKVWLMTLGSFPFWLLLAVLIHPDLPSMAQTFNTFLVALCSGVIATSLFLYARGHANTTQEVAGVDATQASEVIFALIGGVLLLGTPLPSLLGWIGIVLIVLGLVLFAIKQ